MKIQDIRKPDIKCLVNNARKYADFIDSHPQEITLVGNKWSELLFDKFIPMSMEMRQKPFANLEQMQEFSVDCKNNAKLALYVAWAIGREYAETNPDNAKYCLLIDDCESDFLLPSTRSELVDLSDFASMLILQMFVYVHHKGEIDEFDLVRSIETARTIFREGILLVFKDGIASYYKS